MEGQTRKLSPYIIGTWTGQNNRDNATKIRPDQAQKAQNVFTDQVAAVSSQPKAVLKATIPNATGGTGLWSYRTQSGTDHMIAFLTGVGLAISTDGVTWTAVAGSEAWVNNFPEAVTLNGRFWLCGRNNTWPLIGWDGTDWIPAGAAKVAADSGGTNLTGTYKWMITRTIDGEEIQACPTFSLTLSGQQAILSKIDLGPANMTAMALYRTKGTGGTFYKASDLGVAATLNAAITAGTNEATVVSTTGLVPGQYYTLNQASDGTPGETVLCETIVSGTVFSISGVFAKSYATSLNGITTTFFNLNATTFTDNAADGSLGAELTTPNPGIPVAYYPVTHKQMMFLLKSDDEPSGANWSIPDFPFLFPADNIFALPVREETIWGGFEFKETLVVATGMNLGVLSGDNVFEQFTFDWRVKGIGCLFHRSMQTIYKGEQQFMKFRSADGYYLYDGSSNPTRTSDDILPSINTMLGPDLDYESNTITTETDWESGDPGNTVDTTTVPGQIQLPALAQTFATPTWTGSTLGGGSGRGLRASSWMPQNPNPRVPFNGTVALQANAGIADYTWTADFLFPPQTADTVELVFNFVIQRSAQGNYSDWRFNYFYVVALASNPQGRGTVEIPLFNNSARQSFGDPLYINGVSMHYNGTDSVLAAQIPQQKIFGIRYYMGATYMTQGSVYQATDITSLSWNTTNIQLSVKEYALSGTWVGPVVPSGFSSGIDWKEFLSTYQANNQVIQYFVRSAATSGAIAAATWIPITPGSIPPYAPTDGYFQEKIVLSILSAMDLPAQESGAKTYEADDLPDNYNLTIHNDPDIDNSPFTKSGTTGFYQLIPDATSKYGKAVQLGIGNENITEVPFTLLFTQVDAAINNVTGWTMEFGVKISPDVPYFGAMVWDGTQIVGVTMSLYSGQVHLQLTYYSLGGGIQTPAQVIVSIQDGRWHAIRLTGKGTQFNVYVDGGLEIGPVTVASSFRPQGIPSAPNVSFGLPPNSYTAANYLIYLSYVSWYNNGDIAPGAVDQTTRPIVYDTTQSWLVSPNGIFPSTTVAAAVWKNRYWCSETELNGSGQSYNNVVLIYDTKGNWLFRRGTTNGFDRYVPTFIGAMTIFQNNLWWVESNSGNIVELDQEPQGTDQFLGAVNNSGDTPVQNDLSIWTRGKEDFGIPRVKQFEYVKVRYYCSQNLTLTATVDDVNVTTFTLPPSDGSNEVILYFLSDGRQIGVFLQLEYSNSANQNLPYFAIYSQTIQMSVMDYESVPQIGVTT